MTTRSFELINAHQQQHQRAPSHRPLVSWTPVQAPALLQTLALLLTATLVAEEDQSVMQSAMGVLGMGSPAQPAAVPSDHPDLLAED